MKTSRRVYHRQCRFKSIDPLAEKYAGMSPYAAFGLNPIMYVDPDGREKIVVIGGRDKAKYQFDEAKFWNAGLLQADNYLKLSNKETVTILLISNNLSKSDIKFAKAVFDNRYSNNVNLTIANTDKQIINYINSKSTLNSNISENRQKDQISEMSFFGHGLATLGFMGDYPEIDNESKSYGQNANIGINDLKYINQNSFSNNSQINLFSCNSATFDKKSEFDVSFAKAFSKASDSKVIGWAGKVDYGTSNIYNHNNSVYSNSNIFERGLMKMEHLTGGSIFQYQWRNAESLPSGSTGVEKKEFNNGK